MEVHNRLLLNSRYGAFGYNQDPYDLNKLHEEIKQKMFSKSETNKINEDLIWIS